MAAPDLQQTLDRLATTLEKSGRQGLRALAETGRAIREDAKEARREQRRQLRAQKREEQRENASVVGGVFGLLMALVLVAFAVGNLQYWWLVFVALGVGSGGAKQLSLAAERKRLEKPQKKQDDALPQQHEVDALCDQLLSDLKASPEAVRAFVQQPEATVEALRSTAKAVDQRRKDLAAQGTKDQLLALEKQRSNLKSRRDGSADFEARAKFDGALRSLDGQEAALRLLMAVSDRLDGEYTSLVVLLQELKTRVAVARSTDGGAQLEGLQQNVQRLNAELEAITDSLQRVHSPVDEGAVHDNTMSSPERERLR
jgi:uncharacterized protein YukE